MASLDLSGLTTQDAIAALRSYPRRYRALLLPLRDDENVEELARRVGPEGVSALDLTLDSVRTFAILGRALQQVLLSDRPTLHAAVSEPAERVWDDVTEHTVEGALDELKDECDELAEAVGKVPSRDWERTGTVAGSGQVLTAFDLVREAVRTGAENLRRAELALRAARGR